MYKSLVFLCIVFCVIEARPKWQFLPDVPGYVPVYIRNGDTPLEEINPELAEAFHALPAGRSAGKQLDASPEIPELPQANQPQPELSQADQPQPELSQADQPQPELSQADQPQPELPQADQPQPELAPAEAIDHRPYEKKYTEKKAKKSTEILKPIDRR